MISTVYQHCIFMQEQYSGTTAFQYYDDEKEQVQSVTFSQYIQDIQKFAIYLEKQFPDEKGRKRHVGIIARNSYHYMVCVMGIMLTGAVAVLLNQQETWENIRYEIEFADVGFLLHDGIYAEREPELVKKYGTILHGIDEYASFKYAGMCSDDLKMISEKWKEKADVENRLAMLLFTSATTGRSKCVMLSVKNLYAPMKYFMKAALRMQSEQTQKYFQIVPMHHISGVTTLLTWTALGITINICQEIRYLYRDLKLMPSSMTSAVPMVLMSFYKDIRRGKIERLGGLKSIVCVAAPANHEVFQTFREHGIVITQAYGMTEIGGSGTNNSSQDPAKELSVGKPGAGCLLKIDQGEICLKSDSVMSGYYKNPEATAEVIHDGWLYTGDLGYMDEDGYLYVTGRKKNLIILSGGENVSPEELESLLLKNTKILETMVRQKGDRISAEIFCKEQDQEEVRQYVSQVNKGLAHYKRITNLEFRDNAFPRTSTGKMKRI